MRRLTVFLAGLVAAGTAHAVELDTGDVLVALGGRLSAGNGAVIHIDPATGVQTEIASGETLLDPRGIAVEASGDLVVTDHDVEGGAGVYRIDAGTSAHTVVSSGNLLSLPRGIAVEASGQILVADPGAVAIIRIDPTTGNQTTVSSGGLLVEPSGLALEAGGQILVADPGRQNIIRVDPASGAQTPLLSSPEHARDVAVLSTGDIVFVVDFALPFSQHCPPYYGKGLFFLRPGGSPEELSGECFAHPMAVATTATDHVLVAHDGGLRLLGLIDLPDPTSTVLLDSSPSHAYDLAVSAGEMFAVHPFSLPGKVFKASVNGSLGAESIVSSSQGLRSPAGIAVDPAGDLIVTDKERNAVVKIDPATGTVTDLSVEGFFGPAGPFDVAIAANGDLIVANAPGTSPVVRVDPISGQQTVVTSGGNFTGGASHRSLAFEASGDIVVGELATEVIRVDPATGEQTLVASDPALNAVVGIGVADDGGILVGATAHDSVVRVDPVNGGITTVSAGGSLGGPMDIAVAADGTIWVADYGTGGESGGVVVAIDPSSGTQSTLASGLARPLGIAIVQPACHDGFDNDGDGWTDFRTDPLLSDPGCLDAEFPKEDPQCQDGVDNDGQTGIDLDGGASVNGGVPLDVPDPQCTVFWEDREAAWGSGCGVGVELALLLAPLMWLHRRRRRTLG